jgi:hypothetical protein
MNYIKWLFTDHYFNNKQGVIKFIGTIFGFFLAIYVPGPVLDEYYGGWIPLLPVIGVFFAVYGFLIAILLQPYGIYKRINKLF